MLQITTAVSNPATPQSNEPDDNEPEHSEPDENQPHDRAARLVNASEHPGGEQKPPRRDN